MEYSNLSVLNLSKYEINNNGIIKNVNTKKTLKIIDKGYLHYFLINDNNERKNYSMHRLVALIFIPNPKKYEEVNHIDKNIKNNNYLNLEWINRSDNLLHKEYNNDYSFREVIMKKGDIEILFKSYKEAYNYLKLKDTIYTSFVTSISECCNNKQKTAYSYQWSYKINIDLNELKDINKWKKVFDDIYINREGILFNIKYKREYVGSYQEYHRIQINKKSYFFHRLVAEAFIPNPNNYKIVNHINSNKLDNRVENLEWCSHSFNSLHSAKKRKGYNKIIKYDLNNNKIKEYDSVKDICIENPSYIDKALYYSLSKNVIYKDYFWKRE